MVPNFHLEDGIFQVVARCYDAGVCASASLFRVTTNDCK